MTISDRFSASSCNLPWAPAEDNRRRQTLWQEIADDFCPPSEAVRSRGKEIMKHGIKNNDALHIASAIKKQCEYFITTDKGLTNKNVDGSDVLPPPTLISATADTRLEAGASWELPSNDRILTKLSPCAPRFLLWLTPTGARLRS